MARLEGRRILVTGAASGIDAAAVRVLTREGAAEDDAHGESDSDRGRGSAHRLPFPAPCGWNEKTLSDSRTHS